MASDPPAPNPPPPGGLQSMLDRLKGMVDSLNKDESEEEILPTWDVPLPPPAGEAPVAVEPLEGVPVEAIPEAVPVAPAPVLEPERAERPAPPPPIARPAAPAEAEAAAPAVCPVCHSKRAPGHKNCVDCGFFFPEGSPSGALRAGFGAPAMRAKQRYEFGELVSEHGGVSRYRGYDLGLAGNDRLPVIVVRQPSAVLGAEALAVEDEPPAEEIVPDFDEAPPTEVLPLRPAWPSVAWERQLLDTIEHPGLPAVLDSFSEGGYEYLVEEVPSGQLLWDAWDDPDATYTDRFRWLSQVAETMQALHRVGALFESIRPDIVVVNEEGVARLTDLSDLLPLPLPPDAPMRGGLYTAPELLAGPDGADARANLYSFGAMLYALTVGRELSLTDFDKPGQPKPFIPHFPDVHPAFGRLVSKTFCRNVAGRFPSDEAQREDATGFTELVRALLACGRSMDHARLEIGAWTTTGMVRTGNEDALALLHSCETRQEDVAESALILLADGMGGYEAGEVAAALAIKVLRTNLTAQKPFAALAGSSGFQSDQPRAEGNDAIVADVEEIKRLIRAALKDANKQVFNASRSGVGRRGMGCTAEAVYVDGRNVVVGHVGDSRTYHLCEGRLVQLTRDQTLVSRLVELGTLTEEEAENHPRRNELQQAVGGQPDVEPGIYHAVLKPGDYLIVCSDGVSNHVKFAEFRQFLQGDDGVSAERAARRLVNLCNIEGAHDNATVVVVRAT